MISAIKRCIPLALLFTTVAAAAPADPIRLHPQNGHYLLFRGKPTVLVSSGEHYGSVLNLDIDYETYLDTMKAQGMRLTRLFSGTYREIPGSFSIAENTLAPAPERYAAPWARSATPGYSQGGSKFDLTRWDDAYFRRLKDFIAQADKRGIVVEVVLFCPFYDDSLWNADPMNAANNVNAIGAMPREEVYTLKHPEMVAVHDAVARKIVTELNGFDNVYFEICNEPYFGGVTLEWQRHIADTIVHTEAGLRKRHLIAQNIANGSAKVTDPMAAVSIFNSHYASPPTTVAENYGLNRVISFDESGFAGQKDETYRKQAWQFLMAGGAIFDNLDYSFSVNHPRGDFTYPSAQPGGGSAALRAQLATLSRFAHTLDFVHMAPVAGIVTGLSAGAEVHALGREGREYALYLFGSGAGELTVTLPDGDYALLWLDPVTGKETRGETVAARGGTAALRLPAHGVDLALRLSRKR